MGTALDGGKMAKLIPKNEATLRAIMKLGNATLHDVETIIPEGAKNAINSLHRCEFIEAVGTRSTRTKQGCVKDIHLYSITDKGRQKLQDVDFPKVAEMRSVAASKLDTKLHQMQHLIIPIRDPSVKEMIEEIDGRQVKKTYGVHHKYEVYVPPPDHSRNYTPRPIRGILGL